MQWNLRLQLWICLLRKWGSTNFASSILSVFNHRHYGLNCIFLPNCHYALTHNIMPFYLKTHCLEIYFLYQYDHSNLLLFSISRCLSLTCFLLLFCFVFLTCFCQSSHDLKNFWHALYKMYVPLGLKNWQFLLFNWWV